MVKATRIITKRTTRPNGSFTEIAIYEVPMPVRGSLHPYKYRMVYVVDGTCVLRYDNEAGKGDHKHVGAVEIPYSFIDMETLLRDFYKDVERMEP